MVYGMIILFVILMVLKVPIAFSMLGSSVLYFLATDMQLTVVITKIVEGTNSFALLAAPGFILAGCVMNITGLTDRLFDFCGKMLGHIRGGLGHANVLASIIFAGMSGAAIADAGGLGAIELRAMRKAGYPDDFSLAVTAASSIIGPIIPPSVPMVLFAIASSGSVGRLLMGGAIPGLLLGAVQMFLIYAICKRRNLAPSPRAQFSEIWKSFVRAIFALVTPIVILGSILTGICTPTEASMIAVVYSIILGFFYRTINFKNLFPVFKEAAETTCTVMFIVACAGIFGYILSYERIPQILAETILSVMSNKYLIILSINLFLLLVGCFMDSSVSIIILTPILLPIAQGAGMDLVQFGVMMVLNLMIGLTTPPVGMVLYVMAKVGECPFEKVAKAIWPFIIVSVIVLLIVAFVPAVSLWLPNLIYN